MVTFRIWNLVVVGIVVTLFAGTGGAADYTLTKAEADRRAKAALALAAASCPAKTVVIAALTPKEVVAKAAACVCGETCQCANGKCPAQCPTGYTSCIHPDTTGRLCYWDWPRGPTAKPIFRGYASSAEFSTCPNGTCGVPYR